MARISRNEQIVHRMEALALDMLEGTKDVNLDIKMDVFERVGKWVSIKNKLENQDGGDIRDYKRILHGESEIDKHPAAARRSGRKHAVPNGGSRLEAIKSRIPKDDAGDTDGDSVAVVGPHDPAPERNGSDNLGVAGNAEP